MAQRLELEILKLMLQVAWSDDELAPAERTAIERVALAWGLSDDELALVLSWADRKKPLPAPDLGLLKKNRDHVLQSVRYVVDADGKHTLDEEQLVQQIQDMLA